MPAESNNNNLSAIIPSIEAAKNATSVKVSFSQATADDSNTIYEKLDHAFGIAIESGNGILAPEFEESPEIILKLQTMVRKIKLDLDKDVLSFHLDDLIIEAVNSIQPRKGTVENEHGLGRIYNIPHFDTCAHGTAAPVFDYLLGFYGRCNSLVNQYRTGISASIFTTLSERSRVQFILFLRGLLCANTAHQDASIVFAKFLLTNATVCETFLHDLVVCCKTNLTDAGALGEVFDPILDIFRSCAINNSATKRLDDYCEIPFDILKKLLDIKLADNSRPIAELIVSRANFHPKKFATKNHRGREIVHTSFLGPFFSLSVAGNQSALYESNFEDTEIAFDQSDTDAMKEAKIMEHQSRLGILRLKMHSIFHAIIVNASTRKVTLDYISEMFEQNRKLSQMQAEYDQLANCTSMLNMLSVMLDLSDKIAVDKIQDDYIFHKDCRLNMREENGIKMDKAQLVSYRATADVSYTPSFNTECFYLTLAYMGISMNTMVNNHRRTKRLLYDIQRQVRDAEERINRIQASNSDLTQITRTRAALQRAAELLKKFSLSNMCYECLLYDHAFLAKCAAFVNKLLRILLRNIMPNIGIDPSTFKPNLERFTSFPETFLENGIDFMQFLFGGNGQRFKILLEHMPDYPQLILHLVINLSNIKNPFLASKIVDLLFYICPDVHPEGAGFFRQIINDPLSVQKLFPALVKFYADVESTGSHTEFYDKFNIRRNIQVVFQNMWRDLAHRDRMIKFAGESSPDFYRFINMVINDTTFLLDESLEKLKRIHEIETQMSNELEWGKLGEEERKHRLDALVDAKRQVKTWLQLGSETMELFVTLTGDAPQIFRQEALGERVAAMLNHNLIQLFGPKCSDLKVHDAQKRFNWDPRKLAELIVKVYVNLASEQFGKQIAQDERSYKSEHFDQALKILKAILPINQYELFKNLADQAKKAHEEKAHFEEEFEEDCPDEFRCAIMFTMMSDPVTLPSGQVVERKNILRHLLSDPHNPFSRQPLTDKDLQPNYELKNRIKNWVQEMKSMKKGNHQ